MPFISLQASYMSYDEFYNIVVLIARENYVKVKSLTIYFLPLRKSVTILLFIPSFGICCFTQICGARFPQVPC